MKKILEFVKKHSVIWQLLLFALAYFAMGKLGMFLAVPPGYATAIYPPSGIALAGILLWGYRAWFGVFLGSFLLNLSIAESHATIENYIPIVIAVVIATGATLQAVAGAYFIKRFADFPNPLANEKNVFTFMFYGGFLSTLVNSTISVSTLAVMNQIPLTNFFTNWSTWWMGDAIGVFIFAPLMLVWLYPEKDYFRHRRLVISSTIVAAFSLTVLFVIFETNRETKHLKIEFEKDALAFNVALNKSIAAHLSVLRSLGSFYASSVSIERDEFHQFVYQALSDFKGIQALEWCPLVMDAQREALEKSVQKEGFSSFEIKESDVNNNLIRANNREFYVPVIFVEPLKNNEIALGYDLNSNAIRRKAIEKARDTGEITVIANITLVQDNQAGFLAFSPIYKNHLPHQSLQERRKNILGYVLAVFHINDIFTVALSNTNSANFHLKLFDNNAPTQEQRLLFSNQLTPFSLHEKGLFGRNISLTSSTLIRLGNQQWQFEVMPTQDYFAYHRSDNSWLILLAGLVLTSISGVFVMVSTGREMALQQLLDERTKDLIKIDLALKRSNMELQKESDKTLTLLRNASDGITVVNDKGYVVDCSDSFCTMLGYSREEMIGMHVSQWDVGVPQDELMHLVNELFKQRTRSEFETRHIRKDGTIYDAEISGCPIQFDDEWVYFCATRDVTERKQIEKALLESGFRWKFAVEGSGDGLWDWSIPDNKVFFSSRWKEMLGFNVDEISDSLDEWATRIHPDDKDEVMTEVQNYFEGTLKNYVNEHRVRCKDGNYKWILDRGMIVDRDSEGNPLRMIGTHTDITESKKMEAELKRSNAELEQFAYAVSHDMRQPLRMVTSYLSLIEKALQTQLDDDTRQFLAFAVDGAKRMDSMILALLDYSRVGRQNEAFSVISTRAAVEEALVFLKPLLETSGGKVEILGNWVDLAASRDELTRLFQNLIGNALKYHEEDKPLLVEVIASVKSTTFRVEVRDNGIGIASNQMDRLFKVFSRLQARSRFEGTGVGLALCRKIVEHHGGKIGVESEGEGLGCTFWFELPIVE